MKPSLLLTGISIASGESTLIATEKPGIAWLEVTSEDFFGEGNHALPLLQKLREDYPISLHGMNLSIGSADELNWQYLKLLRDLSEHIDPCLISDHLSWSSINGRYLPELLPLPFTEESLAHVTMRVQQIQGYLKRQLLLENIASDFKWHASSMTEAEFLTALVKQTGCGILLDIKNIALNAKRFGEDPLSLLAQFPAEMIHEIHVDANHWELYKKAIQYLGRKPTIVESRHDNIPHYHPSCHPSSCHPSESWDPEWPKKSLDPSFRWDDSREDDSRGDDKRGDDKRGDSRRDNSRDNNRDDRLDAAYHAEAIMREIHDTTKHAN